MSQREGSSSSGFQGDESLLAMANGRKTSDFEDLTFRSSPGSPVAASTVARPLLKDPNQNERMIDDVDMRGSLFGVEDVRAQEKQRKPGKRAHFKLSPIRTPSPLSNPRDPTTANKEGTFAMELDCDNTSGIEDFIQTHNVSDLLEKVDYSTSHISTSRASTRDHMPLGPPEPSAGRASITVGGMGTSQDWSSLNGDTLRPPEARESLVSLGTEISEVSSLGILNMDDMDMSSSLIHVDSGLLKDLRRPAADNDKEFDTTLRDVSDIEDNFPEGETDEDDSVRVRKAMASLVKNRNSGDDGARFVQRQETGGQRDVEVKHSHQQNWGGLCQPHSGDEDFHGDRESLMSSNAAVPSHDRMVKSRDPGTTINGSNSNRRQNMDGVKESLTKANSVSKMLPSQRPRDFEGTERMFGGRRRMVEDGLDRFDGYDASDEEVVNGEDERRSGLSRRHVTGGYRQQRSLDSGPSSLHSSMDRLDSMFFNHSDQTTSQRPGSGDGGEVFPPTPIPHSPVPPSPSRLSWMGSHEGAFPSGEECPNPTRVDSRISAASIKFDDGESVDAERRRYFRPEVRGKATGVDSVESSEIDTEDELAAVRKENAKQASYLLRPVERLCVGDSGESSEGRLSRPGLEGGSSDENEGVAFPSNREGISLRQSAEGEVVSPVPGDGGGGGDGMSDGETGSTVTAPSVVVSGHSAFDVQRGLGMALSVQGVAAANEGRDVEGQSRTQPVGDGIVSNDAPTRQVRFASVDRTWQRTLSGSDFDMHSSDQSSLNETTNTPTMEVTPSLSQFLLPNNHHSNNSTLNATAASAGAGGNWMHNASSFHISQMSGFQEDLDGSERGDVMTRSKGAGGGSNDSLERTLTPSGMQAANFESPTRLFAGASSFGGFGETDDQFPNDHDFTFSQKLSFGEGEFSELYRGSFSSEHSSDRHSSDREGPGGFYASACLRESTEGAPQQQSDRAGFLGPTSHQESQTRMSFGKLGFADPEQHTGPVYFDENGEGVTDLAFRTSLPLMHFQGVQNPFDTSREQQHFPDDMKDAVGDVNFGVGSDEEFVTGDIGAVMLEQDEQAFEEDHILNQDDDMSPPADSQYSNWSLQNTSQGEIKGDELFCRISMGEFISRRTEALGSLSGEAEERPNFGDGTIISPPTATPVAIFESESPPSHTVPATSERYSGVGQYTVESHLPDSQMSTPHLPREASTGQQRSPRPNISGREDDLAASDSWNTQNAKGSVQNDWQQLPHVSRSTDDTFPESDDLLDDATADQGMPFHGQPQGVHQRVAELVADAEQSKSGSGTKTPPLNISSIATAIAAASSTTNAEDLAAMIMGFSNKQRDTFKAKTNRPEEKKPEADKTQRPKKEDKDSLPKPVDKVRVNEASVLRGTQRLPDEDKQKKMERDGPDDSKTYLRSGTDTYGGGQSSHDFKEKAKDFPIQTSLVGSLEDGRLDLSLIPSKETRQSTQKSNRSNSEVTNQKVRTSNAQQGNDSKTSKSRQRFLRQEGRVVNGDGMERPELTRLQNNHPRTEQRVSSHTRMSGENFGNNEMLNRRPRSNQDGSNMERNTRNGGRGRPRGLQSDISERRHGPSNRQRPTENGMSTKSKQRNQLDNHEMANVKRSSRSSSLENTSRDLRGKKLQTLPSKVDYGQTGYSAAKDSGLSSNFAHSQLRNDSEPDGEANSASSVPKQRSRPRHMQRANHEERASSRSSSRDDISPESQNRQSSQRLVGRQVGPGDEDYDINGAREPRNERHIEGEPRGQRHDRQHQKDFGIRHPVNGARERSSLQLPQRQPTTGQNRLSRDASGNRLPTGYENGSGMEVSHPKTIHSNAAEYSASTKLNSKDRVDDTDKTVHNSGNQSYDLSQREKDKSHSFSSETVTPITETKSTRRTLPPLPRDSSSSVKDKSLDESVNTKYARQVEAIKQAIKEGKDMMSYISSSPESDASITSLTPSPEDTPTLKGKFLFVTEDSQAREDVVVREMPQNGDGEEQLSPEVSARESGRRTSTPSEKSADVTLNRDELERDSGIRVDNERDESRSPSTLHRQLPPSVSSFQAFPDGPHFTINPHTTVPTLLTSQPLMTTSQVSQYLNDRPIVHSRAASSLSSHGLSSHLGHQQALVTTHDPQSLYGALAGTAVATSTAPYYTHMAMQQQAPGHFSLPSAPVHLQSTYPSSGDFLPSLPSFQRLPPGPGLAATGVISQLQSAAGAPQPPPPSAITSGLVVPDQLRFKDVCCLGIASQSVLPLHNPGTRWLQCTLEVVSVTANGEEIANTPPVFIIKPRSIVSPHTTDEMKILFAPHQPGVYTAQVQVGSSPVVADTETRLIQHAPPQMVVLTALAERPNVEFDLDNPETKSLDFGEMGTGLTRSKRIHLVNRGRSTVPIRLLLTSSSSAWHYFSLSIEAKKAQSSNSQHPTAQGGASAARPLHITLDSKREGDKTPESTMVWVHFKAPPDQVYGGSSRPLGPPDSYFAKLEVELDVPGRQAMALAELNLKAVVGVARLHAPTSMQAMFFSSTVGRTVSRNLPLKNAGNIHLDIEMNVTQASELFSVVPENLLLSPDQERDVLVKYMPKQAPSVVESLLTMQIRPDGSKYEVVLRGEATIGEKPEERSENTRETAPVLLCNKQFIAWGGVPVGRALQQKVTLRNSSDTQQLKLRVSVRGAEEFQLQSCFNSPTRASDNNHILINPLQDYQLHLLFSPTQVETYQSTLIIKQSGSGTKYTVPLSGYGGVSKLLIDDVNTIGDMYNINVGPVNAGEKFVCTLKVRNTGPRAAFAKVISFADLRAKVKLPSSRLSVEPQEFVLNSQKSRTLTLIFNMSERDSALCMDRSSLVGVVGFFCGDEISRQQYKKSLHHGESTKMHLSSDNPLRGIAFQDTFLGEEHVTEVCDLPLRPNDQRVFYSCMSRVMVTLVGNPPGSDGMDLNDLTLTEENTPTATGAKTRSHTNRGNMHMVSFTPPVRDIPGQAAVTPMSLQPTGPATAGGSTATAPAAADSSETWIVVPERLMLEAPHRARGAHSTESKPRVVLINYTNRIIRFEMSWPAHILAVTPQNGVIEPKSQVVVLVSAKHSIYRTGEELPWKGYLHIRCDGKRKDIPIQVRQDLAMDTSIYPTAETPQAMQLETVTPYVTKPKSGASSPGAVRVKSKCIEFPRTKLESTSEATLEFQNTKNEEMKWCLSSIASAYVKQGKEVFRVTYSVFRFARQSGTLGPGQKIKVILTFIPRDEGTYSQYWDLESHTMSRSGPSSHGTKIELLGEGYQEPRPSRTTKVKSPPKKQQENSSTGHRQRSGSRDRSSSASLEEISLIPKKKDAPEFQMNPISLKKDVLEFDRIEPGASQTQKLAISNSSLHNQLVNFIAPEAPFSIKHSKHNFKPRYFISLPIAFKPTKPGRYESALVIETKGGHRRVAKLIGQCYGPTYQSVV